MLAPYPSIENVPFEDRRLNCADASGEFAVRIYRPDGFEGPLPALLWLHGGGYIMGSIEMDVEFLQHMALAVGCMIVSVDYRLAPEHPFPCALDDAYTALIWLYKEADQLGVDSQRIAIGGISGGGGLAAGLGIYARDKGEVPLIFQLLLCPMIDDRNITASSYFPLTGMAWDRRSNLNAWGAYLNRSPDDDPMATPVSEYAAAARAENLTQLPPTYISVGSVDLFMDENIEFARRLLAEGVQTSLFVHAGGFHAFECIAAEADVAKRSVRNIQDALKG